jgi:uncharacterized protein (DUF2147 family)
MAEPAPDPTGYWLTQNKRSVIEVKKCGASLCGHIHWIIEGGMQTDSKNPNAAKRGTKMCGLQILSGFSQNANNAKVWEGGKIYKADEGEMYSATLSVKSASEMNVRGYVGVPLFGKSQNWTRVSAKDYKRCK